MESTFHQISTAITFCLELELDQTHWLKMLGQHLRRNETSEEARVKQKTLPMLGERYRPRHKPNAPLGDVVTEPYALYFGLFAEALSVGVFVVYIKRGVVEAQALRKGQCHSETRRTKAAQQNLNNHILLCKTNGIGYVPRS